MKNSVLLLMTGLLLAGGSLLSAQNPAVRGMSFAPPMADKGDVTYGRVKELTMGQKVVIDVDNSIDKTFDLTDKDVAVKMGKGLKVGDPVKVTEHSVAGVTKSVQIVHHTGGGVSHGDKKTAAEEKK